jgi:hypothetical protein
LRRQHTINMDAAAAAAGWMGQDRVAKVVSYQNTDNAAEMYDINMKVLKGQAQEIMNKTNALRLAAERRADQQHSSPPPAAPASAPAPAALTSPRTAAGARAK